MNEQETLSSPEDEIDLIDLVSVLLKRKWLIIGITGLSMIGALLFAVGSLLLPPETSYLPNEYTPKAHMMINDSSSSGGGMASMLASSGLGGLASLAGVNVASGSTYSALAVYLAGTNSFLDSVVDRFNLIERYKIEKSPRAESRKALKEKLSASMDDEAGVFTISFTDIDPAFAQEVVNYSVQYMEERFTEMGLDKNKLQKENLEANIQNTYNEILKLEAESQKLDRAAGMGQYTANGSSMVLEATRIKRELSAQEQVYTQLKTQYELLKVQMASESPVFQVLEYAEVPDQKSGPSRGMLCIIITFAAFFGSVFLVFVLNAWDNIKKDPLAMAKLSGGGSK
ncbi:lipopolysaccharide biosynthesis protein [Treponema zuelzerae]|uniref:Lipopolysaccharide biosynthesis protein n=1 Tax=Teretinema zuelzerae TaxID=156 RepID=A0AAE3EEU8_9SPIR|nr:GNVR domain-containing protein [Teretinema zuelzerae]MCD1653154.1 lipopolysaccharide biosynthesis protein [Teretinema zuelzerae]